MKNPKKQRAEGAEVVSGQAFCDDYSEVMTNLLADFRKEVAAATPMTVYEWGIAFDIWTRQKAFAQKTMLEVKSG